MQVVPAVEIPDGLSHRDSHGGRDGHWQVQVTVQLTRSPVITGTPQAAAAKFVKHELASSESSAACLSAYKTWARACPALTQ